MTDIERWKVERAALDEKIAEAEADQVRERARTAFRRLADDESLPLISIMQQALAPVKVVSSSDPDRAVMFLDRLPVIVDAYAKTQDG